MKFRPLSPLAVMVLLLTACSSVTGVRTRPDDYSTKGVRYWLAAPYLLVAAPLEVHRDQSFFIFDRDSGLMAIPDAKWVAPTAQPTSSTSSGSGGTSGVSFRGIDDPIVLASLRRLPRASVHLAEATGQGDFGTGADDVKNASGDDPSTMKDASSAGDKGKSASPKPTEKNPSNSSKSSVSLVWLPDYCHQYALRQRAVLASQKTNLTLVDGWKLGSLETEQDSTALVGKLIDLAGTLIGARKEIQIAELEAEAAPSEGEPQVGEKRIHLLRERVVYLKPGLYPLLERQTVDGGDECDQVGHITLAQLEYRTSTVWSQAEYLD